MGCGSWALRTAVTPSKSSLNSLQEAYMEPGLHFYLKRASGRAMSGFEMSDRCAFGYATEKYFVRKTRRAPVARGTLWIFK